MKQLTLTALSLLTGLNILACSSPADVAQQNDGPDESTTHVDLKRSQVPPVTNPDVSDGDYAAFIADANSFGLGLHQRLNQDLSLTATNGVFSPASAQLALAMTYGAAVGDTAAAMKSTLRDNLGAEKYHLACNRLQRDLASRNYSRTDNQGYTWRIELLPANSLWTDRTLSIKTPFLDLLSQQYDTGLWLVDFAGQPEPSRLAINGWVEDNTHARIKDLLQQGDIDSSTRFVIANALYFFGNWAKVFDEKLTSPATFHTLAGLDVSVETLHGSSIELPYKAAADFEVLQMPYTNGELWMTLVLPTAGQFEATRTQISGQWLADATTGLSSTNVKVTMPKFKIETPQLKLKDSLAALGMGIVFTSNADFGGMTDEVLSISDVIQKAFIGIDEDGTEAAAATAVMGLGMIPEPPIPLTFDRPFMFFIQDKTGLVLFSGQVVDPTL
jgi:serpin B